MAERVEFDGTHIRVLDASGVVIWADDQQPINLLPDAFTINATVDIQFPDMTGKSFAHINTREEVGIVVLTGCSSYATFEPNHEWGPAESSPYNLADAVLGTVPAGVNYLDVRVTLSRTLAPGNYMGVTIQNELPTEETFLPGGSMLLEQTPSWARAAWIGLDGADVVLSRWQSVGSGGVLVPTATTAGNTPGWYVDVAAVGDRVGDLINTDGPSSSGGSRTYNSGACPPGSLKNWSARWQGSAVIRPGIIAT